MKSLTTGIAALALLGCATIAQAHYLWIERDGPAVSAYFGEWGDDVVEHDGERGLLKAIASPRAFLADGSELEIRREYDHLAIEGAGPKADVRLAEEVVHRGTLVKYWIRGGRGETAAAMDLELVPTEPGGRRFELRFRGAPLERVEVTVMAPPKWEKTWHTDDLGRVTIGTPWAGQYVIKALYDEAGSGELDGKPYTKITHFTTLSFQVEQGIHWTLPKKRP
jgi:hypothetical protein